MCLERLPLEQQNVLLTDHNKGAFQHDLLAWFENAGRNFPWRTYTSAYATLLAEKLLQQTVARDVVVKAYIELLQYYPTPEHLVRAPVGHLEQIIKPLGFLYRAKELPMMAQALIERHNGAVPNNLKDLLALPGVGDYAARAVLSFVYGEDVPIVDVNVARFLYRIYDIAGPLPANPARKRALIAMAANLVPSGRSRDFNLAILDLCALICKPIKPKCLECPVRTYCMFGSRIDSTTRNYDL